MKTVSNIYVDAFSVENIFHHTVLYFNKKHLFDKYGIHNAVQQIVDIVEHLDKVLNDGTYQHGDYRQFVLYDVKRRVISVATRIDRIVHSILAEALMKVYASVLIRTTYACIPGRGISKCMQDIKYALWNDVKGTQWAYKFDIYHFYDNMVHSRIIEVLRRKIRDEKFMKILEVVIGSYELTKGCGTPLGNSTSQVDANVFLTCLDLFVKLEMRAKYYFRYMDDGLVLGPTKEMMHDCHTATDWYLRTFMELRIKGNWQVFNIDKRDVDIVGFRINHYDLRLSRSILYAIYERARKIKPKTEDDIKHKMSSDWGRIIILPEKHRTVIINNILNYDTVHRKSRVRKVE